MRIIRGVAKRRWVWIGLLALLIAFLCVARPILFLAWTALADRNRLPRPAAGIADDVSRLDATPVAEIWQMPAADDAEQQLSNLLARARRQGLKVSIAGARHSMGGQTIAPHGIQIDMLGYRQMHLDPKTNLLDVQAGARWADVLPYLDGLGKSVEIMQANNDFSVGGSLSVNCHGWQISRPPIASSVESFHIMLADGTVKQCSRSENSQLFSLALGGYGLFGIILDAKLHVVPNERYEVHQYPTTADAFETDFNSRASADDHVEMALGRLSVAPDEFLQPGLLYTFSIAPPPDGKLAPVKYPSRHLQEIARLLLRGSVGSDYGKTLRWQMETNWFTRLANRYYTRNELFNQPASVLANRTADSTDLLEEYFIPRGELRSFLKEMRRIIPTTGVDMLNVTMRDVRPDHDTFLRYADQDMIALVLLFNQKFTADSEAKLTAATGQMIDAALAVGGRYYLPYRLQATDEQFHRAYPQSAEFFRLKRQYDPGELFVNALYLKYGRH